MARLLSLAPPFTVSDTTAALVALDSFHTHLIRGTLYATWKKANPGEAAKVEAYWLDPSVVPVVKTETGQAIVAAIDAFHYLKGDHV